MTTPGDGEAVTDDALKIEFAFGSGFYANKVDEFVELARAAEAAGVSMLVTGDSPAIMSDPYVGMAIAAQSTERARVACTVTNPVSRHPLVTACSAATVQHLSGGRAVLGIGTGDSGVYNLGHKPASLADLEEYVSTLRSLWSTGEATFRGKHMVLEWPDCDVPIYMAPGGPQGLRLAGRIADGVIIETGLTEEVIANSLATLHAGADDAGRSASDIDVWWFAKVNLSDSVQTAAHEVRSGLASSANHTFRFSFDGKSVPEELHARIRELQRRYVFRHHVSTSATSPNAELVDELGLRDYLIERFAIVGSPQDWHRRIRELAAHGVRKLVLAALMPRPTEFLSAFASDVMPLLDPKQQRAPRSR